MTFRVWVIEGEREQRAAICTHLADAGMEVQGVACAAELHGLMPNAPEVIVCNTNLPDESGLSVAAWLRMSTRAGVILLTASQRRADRFLGLSLGVDHCLTQPVDLDELELLARNLHRRLVPANGGASAWPFAQKSADAGPDPAAWSFDAARWRLVAPTGRGASLSMAEHLILGCLLQNIGEAVSRDTLLTALRGRRISVYSRNLDMIVSRLRKKVERNCGVRLPVRSARGVGYVFTANCRILKGAVPDHSGYPALVSSNKKYQMLA